jgi:hypothetical protein
VAFASVQNLIWMAEVYWDLEVRLQQLGFDVTYDKGFHDRLSQASPAEIHAHLRGDAARQQRMVRFLENHDEPRAAVSYPGDKLFAMSVGQALLPGMRFYYNGQLEGCRIRPAVQLARAAPEPVNTAVQDFYRRLLKFAGEDVFHRGTWQMLNIQPEHEDDPSSANLIAWQWMLDADLRIVVVNLADSVSQGRVICRGVGPVDLRLVDDLNDQTYLRNGAEMSDPGLYVRLNGHAAHVFRVAS